eukprot:m.50616 g.50616  ORF g.50616 m.50616 type:complete len:278 (-) comp18060_c0_seq2:47-880(-)
MTLSFSTECALQRIFEKDSDFGMLTKLAQGVVNSVMGVYSSSLLMQACACNAKAVVEVLLEHGADLEYSDERGYTALIDACRDSSPEIVTRLLSAGANLHRKGNNGRTPLMFACEKGNLQVINALLTGGVDVNAVDKISRTALMWASFHGTLGIIEKLLASGADVTAKGLHHETALSFAVVQGHKLIAKALLSAGADVNELHLCLDGIPFTDFDFESRDLMPRWSMAAHTILLPQPHYKRKLYLLVWCLHRTCGHLPDEMVWYVLSFNLRSEMVRWG